VETDTASLVIGEGIVPENLIHRQLVDEVWVIIFAIALDADDQVTDVIFHFGSGHWRREFAMEPHGTNSRFPEPPTALARFPIS
jgi:hypothetical protein